MNVTAEGGNRSTTEPTRRSNAIMGKDMFSEPVDCEAAEALIAASMAMKYDKS